MVSEPIMIALIVATPPTLAVVVALIRVRKMHHSVQQLRVEVDGRLSELLKLSGAEGEVRGREAAHRERDERNA